MIIHTCRKTGINLLATILFVLLLGFSLLQNVAAKDSIIRIAITTSMVNSGLSEVLISAFELKYPFKIEVFATGSGNVLRRARTGKADLTITHAPSAEEKIIKQGYGIKRQYLMRNEFILLGPANNPAGINNMDNILTAMQKIAMNKALFISRGDDSGTNKKEISIWVQANIDPYGDWYIETGTGQAGSLKIASEKQAYVLTDKGTWIAKRDSLNLKVHIKDDAMLSNPYSLILMNPAKYPSVNHKGAQALANWLLSAEGQKLIGGYKLSGEQLFIPVQPTE